MVALSAGRVVYSAVFLIRSTTSPIRDAACDNPDPRVGLLRLIDRLAGDAGQGVDLAGNLGDRGRQFLAGRNATDCTLSDASLEAPAARWLTLCTVSAGLAFEVRRAAGAGSPRSRPA